MEKTLSWECSRGSAPPDPRCDRLVSRFSRRVLAALLILSAVSIFLRFKPSSFNIAGILDSNRPSCHDVSFHPHSALSSDSTPEALETAESSSNKVPLEAHIMSKCPDAQYCLQHLVVPAMEQIHDKVDFRLSFIGRSNPLPSP